MRRLSAFFVAGMWTLTWPAAALDIQFDFRFDSNNFFSGHADRISALNAAAAVFENRLTDTLTAISPSGANTWNATFDNPTTNAAATLPNLTIGTGVVLVFVGARPLGSGTLGLGGPGGQDATGSQAWLDTVFGRGQTGALAGVPTDFGPWGGALTFDSNASWFFGTGSLSGKDDFLSVATHELGHLLGFGTADSWSNKVSGSKFTGTNSTAANGGIQVSLSGDVSHWAAGTTSTIFGTNTVQETAMDPSITVGTQKFFTTLDFAGLQDVGWTVVPEPSTAGLLALAALTLAGTRATRRRRSTPAGGESGFTN